MLMLTLDVNTKTLLPVSDLPCILSKERDPRASFLTRRILWDHGFETMIIISDYSVSYNEEDDIFN